MQVTVDYSAQIKRAAGLSSERFELGPSGSLDDLAAAIAERHGDAIRDLLLDGAGAVRKSILMFVGDDQVVAGSSRLLADGDTVTIMTPISGG